MVSTLYVCIFSVVYLLFLKWHPNHEIGKRTYYLAIPQTSDSFKTCVSKILIGPLKIIVNPALVLAMILIVFGNDPNGLRNWYGGNNSANTIFGIWKDWLYHFHWSFILWDKFIYGILWYFMGYALISIESPKLDQILKKYGVLYLLCGTCLLLIKVFITMVGGSWVGGFYRNEINYVLSCILLAFGQWMYFIGLYTTMNLLCIMENSIIVKVLRELAMTYYLTHVTVIRCLLVAKIHTQGLMAMQLWVTIVTGMLSLLIAKSPCVLRYFFGLPSHDKALFSQWLKGCGPFALLVVIRLTEYLVFLML